MTRELIKETQRIQKELVAAAHKEGQASFKARAIATLSQADLGSAIILLSQLAIKEPNQC